VQAGVKAGLSNAKTRKNKVIGVQKRKNRKKLIQPSGGILQNSGGNRIIPNGPPTKRERGMGATVGEEKRPQTTKKEQSLAGKNAPTLILKCKTRKRKKARWGKKRTETVRFLGTAGKKRGIKNSKKRAS